MLSGVNCNGNESNILGCSHELIQNGCTSNSTAGVLCGGTTYDYYNAVYLISLYFLTILLVNIVITLLFVTVPCIEDTVRQLSHAPSRSLVVQVCRNSNYTTICGQSWGNEEASVICNQLGFSTTGK